MGVIKNFLYSSVLTVSNYLFPLITYPYISRVLGVTNIGICNFIDSIINYYILFSMMGMGLLAVREIAKNRDNRLGLKKSFSSLLVLNSIFTFISVFLLIISIHVFPTLYEYKQLLYIGVFKVVFNYLLIEWLYVGTENFKLVTQRSIVVKTLYVIAVFLFVKDSHDYQTYYLLSVLMVVVNACFNLWYSRKLVSFSFSDITIKPYLKPYCVLGVYALLTSMYTSFNVVYLGFVAGEAEVGYYTTAIKLYTVLLSLFSAFTGVMLPHMSSLISQGRYEEFRLLISKSVKALFTFVMPLIIFSVCFAPQIISIVSGPGYENSILPMRIVMPLMFIIGYEQIIIIQVLMPLRKDKAILINSTLGAVVGLLINFSLVSSMGSSGSAIAWVAAEITVLCSAQVFVSKYLSLYFPFKHFFYCVLWSVVIAFPCILLQIYTSFPSLLTLSIGSFIIGGCYLFLGLKVMKNELMISMIGRLKKRFLV